MSMACSKSLKALFCEFYLPVRILTVLHRNNRYTVEVVPSKLFQCVKNRQVIVNIL